MNRETWLNQMAEKIAPSFTALGKTVPPFRVSIGFTGHGARGNARGECWNNMMSADRRFEIFITPDQDDSLTVASILTHELCHAAVGFKHRHKGDFASTMKALGFVAPWTTATPTDQFKALVAPFIAELGEVPQAALMFRQLARGKGGKAGKGGEGGDGDGDGEESNSNYKKRQSTRMLKAACAECGYTVRLTKKWALVGAPHCPTHGAMVVDGMEPDAGGGEDEPGDEQGGDE